MYKTTYTRCRSFYNSIVLLHAFVTRTTVMHFNYAIVFEIPRYCRLKWLSLIEKNGT